MDDEVYEDDGMDPASDLDDQISSPGSISQSSRPRGYRDGGRKSHSRYQEVEGGYMCECGRGPFVTKGGVRAHSKMHDVVGNPHACPQCTRSFKRKQVKLFTKFISIFKRF